MPMTMTIAAPLADQVADVIPLFRAAFERGASGDPDGPWVAPPDACRHKVRDVSLSAASWSSSLLLSIGLLCAGALATDLLYPFVSRPTPYSKPTFAVFASVALAGRLAGARGAWFAVLFTWPAEVLLGRTTVDLHELVHIVGTVSSAAVVAACFTPWVCWPEATRAAVRRSWDRASRATRRLAGFPRRLGGPAKASG
jgi:hypothetical protein